MCMHIWFNCHVYFMYGLLYICMLSLVVGPCACSSNVSCAIVIELLLR